MDTLVFIQRGSVEHKAPLLEAGFSDSVKDESVSPAYVGKGEVPPAESCCTRGCITIGWVEKGEATNNIAVF